MWTSDRATTTRTVSGSEKNLVVHAQLIRLKICNGVHVRLCYYVILHHRTVYRSTVLECLCYCYIWWWWCTNTRWRWSACVWVIECVLYGCVMIMHLNRTIHMMINDCLIILIHYYLMLLYSTRLGSEWIIRQQDSVKINKYVDRLCVALT